MCRPVSCPDEKDIALQEGSFNFLAIPIPICESKNLSGKLIKQKLFLGASRYTLICVVCFASKYCFFLDLIGYILFYVILKGILCSKNFSYVGLTF